VELETNAAHENSTYYLLLMKINGEWKIISKVEKLSYVNEIETPKRIFLKSVNIIGPSMSALLFFLQNAKKTFSR
jgi:hypothetical protein